MRGIGVNRNTLMQEFAELLDEKRKSIGIQITESTFPVYTNAYRHMKEFLQKSTIFPIYLLARLIRHSRRAISII
ncbi:hypothetical protein NXW00_01150 [Bacteroides thetaiotaomicron]|nr:hypothetical protein [Bacteroides thetaiotaomicron]